jgi:hypothetical protein
VRLYKIILLLKASSASSNPSCFAISAYSFDNETIFTQPIIESRKISFRNHNMGINGENIRIHMVHFISS